MDFNGTFELEDTTIDEVWLALSDPVMVRDALPGCEFLLEVDTDDPDFDELRERAAEQDDREPTADPEVIAGRTFEEGNHYAALVEIGVGSVNPTFETVVTIDEREKPRMEASGEGSSGNSSFEMASGMELSETDDGDVVVDWWAEADVFGRIAQMGQRVINPVANRVVKRFFSDIQESIQELGEAEAAEAAEDDEGATAEAGSSSGGDSGAGSDPGSDADSGSSADSGSDSGGSNSGGSGGSGGIVARIKRLLGLGG